MRIPRFSIRPVGHALLVFLALAAAAPSVCAADLLETVRDAFRASSNGLESGSGKGVYRVYESVDGGEWLITTDAEITTHFDGKKYFVELRYDPEQRGIACRRIMYNGISLRTAWFSPGMRTRGQVAEIGRQDYGDGLYRPELADFPWDVSKLASNVWDIERLMKSVTEARIRVTQTPEGDLVGTHPIATTDRHLGRFECPKKFGFNVARIQSVEKSENRAVTENRLEWKQASNGVWYVRSLQHEFADNDERKRFRRVIKYTDFDPNAKVDPNVFTKAFLEMPLEAGVTNQQVCMIDERP